LHPYAQTSKTVKLKQAQRFSSASVARTSGTIISIMPLATQALGGVYFIGSYGTYYMQLAGYNTSDSFKLQIAQHGLAIAGRSPSGAI
jgi:membrane-bound lytic murein transglycosylase B